MSLSRKAINFDLDTKALQEHYPCANWRNAYNDIKKFMKSNGFEHRQGSGYTSVNSMKSHVVTTTIIEAYKKYPWLIDCVKKLDVTSVGRTFDLAKSMKKVFDKPIEESTKAEKCSLSALDKNQERVADQERVATLDKNKNKDKQR